MSEEDGKYVQIKGMALVMVREFQKVYPRSSTADVGKRIHDEVWYATNVVIPNAKEIKTEKLHRIIGEIKEAVL